MEWQRRCEFCGTQIPDSADQRKRFCNSQCKNRDYTALVGRERAKARRKLKCQCCRKPIKGAKRLHKYCSLTCQWKADYWRHVEKKRERNRAYSRSRAALLAALLAGSEPALLARLKAEPIPSAVPSPARPQPAPERHRLG